MTKYEAPLHDVVLSRSPNDKSPSVETRDFAFNKHSKQDGKHVSPSDNGKIQIGLDGIQVRLIKSIDTEGFKRVVSMGLRATTGIDLDAPMDADEDTEEMLKGGLQQALESDRIVFAITGVSRACTHQLVRTRAAGFLQQSQRATFFGNAAEVRIPESVWTHENPYVLEAWLRAIDASRFAYQVATENDISYQDSRLILPEGTTNAIVCSYTPREWLNTLAYRGCYMFQWEISHAFREMRKLVVEAHPWLEPHAKISCEKSGKCHFQGWENVEKQCPLPMAREENRLFRSERYAITDGSETPLTKLQRLLRANVIVGVTSVSTSLIVDMLMAKGVETEELCVEAIRKAEHAKWINVVAESEDALEHVLIVNVPRLADEPESGDER